MSGGSRSTLAWSLGVVAAVASAHAEPASQVQGPLYAGVQNGCGGSEGPNGRGTPRDLADCP